LGLASLPGKEPQLVLGGAEFTARNKATEKAMGISSTKTGDAGQYT